MIPVDRIEDMRRKENPEQESRRKEVQEFWDSGVKYAELTIFNSCIKTQTELKHYERASRQLRLGYSKIKFRQRAGKIYAERLDKE